MIDLGDLITECFLAIKANAPIIVICGLYGFVLLVVISATRKQVNREWTNSPEKLNKLIKVKLAVHIKTIEGLLRTVDELKEEKRQLSVTVRAGREHAQQTANILIGGER